MVFAKKSLSFVVSLARNLIEPRLLEPSAARRERALNILILGGVVLGIVIGAKVLITRLYFESISLTSDYALLSPFLPLVFSAIFGAGYFLSRKGYFQIVAVVFLTVCFLAATYAVYVWGIDAPVSLLTYAITIFLSGILIGSRFAFFVLGASTLILMFVSHMQYSGMLSVIDSLRGDLPDIEDAIVYSVAFSIFATVSWVYNREVEQAFEKMYESENRVRRERDKLKDAVEVQTKKLKKEQLEKVAQVYRFVEFGREASGLIHDLVNPLHVVSLNLGSLEKRSKRSSQENGIHEFEKSRVYIERAQNSVRELEQFVLAARRQIGQQEQLSDFCVQSEVEYVLRILSHRARNARVELVFENKSPVYVHGNVLKFNQIIANLVSNAIDSYEKVMRKSKRKVQIRIKQIGEEVCLEVQDWGCGIDGKNRAKLFEPFFTTKDIAKGTGIGLSITKDVVEKDFVGKIDFESQAGAGSVFRVRVPSNNTKVEE